MPRKVVHALWPPTIRYRLSSFLPPSSCLSDSLSDSLPLLSFSLCLSPSLPLSLSVSLSVSVCLCLSLSLSVSPCLSLSLSLSVSLSLSLSLSQRQSPVGGEASGLQPSGIDSPALFPLLSPPSLPPFLWYRFASSLSPAIPSLPRDFALLQAFGLRRRPSPLTGLW